MYSTGARSSEAAAGQVTENTRVFTVGAGVIDQEDLPEEDGRGGVQDAVDRAQQCAPRFIVKHDDYAGGHQGWTAFKRLLYASAKELEKNTSLLSFSLFLSFLSLSLSFSLFLSLSLSESVQSLVSTIF